MAQLLIDTWNSNLTISSPEYITESKRENDGKLIIKNVLLTTTDTPNANKRIYKYDIFKREADNYFKNQITNRQSFCELNHPETRIEIDLKEACAVITNMYWNKNNLMGDLEILEYMPNGNMVSKLLNDKITLSISSRAVGTVTPIDGYDYVNEDLVLCCYDIVSQPSNLGSSFRLSGGVPIKEQMLYEYLKNQKYSEEYILNKKLESYICEYLGKCKINK